MTLPKIDKPITGSQLRDRVLAAMNGESAQLSDADKQRRDGLLKALQSARRAGEG